MPTALALPRETHGDVRKREVAGEKCLFNAERGAGGGRGRGLAMAPIPSCKAPDICVTQFPFLSEAETFPPEMKNP